MRQHYPALLVVIPLLSAFLISAVGWFRRRLCVPIAAAALFMALWVAVGLMIRVLREGEVFYRLGGWPPPWGISYAIDRLNALVLVAVAAVALVNLVANRRRVEETFGEKTGAFATLYVLMVTGLLGMVVTGDAFNLYVLLEIASLSGYGLIAMGGERAPLAALNYVYMGTIGASFYLLGIGYLYMVTGTLNMADIRAVLPSLYASRAVLAAFAIGMVGVWLKMGLFPLHAWLPNAYTFAPSPSAGLIAPLMTKVMVYVMIRLMLSVFSPAYVFGTLNVHNAVVWLAVAAIVMGGLLALMARDLRKMLAYVIVAEVGYMVGGAWLGNRAGMTGAILHIVNDALMTLCLFMAVGNVAYRMKGCSFRHLRGLFRCMPFTMGAFALGGLSIIGVPPTCGFFSKWYLLRGAVQAGHYGFAAALVFSSLIGVILFFRVFEIGYFEPFEGVPGTGRTGPAEVPLGMLLPLLAVAAGLVALGLATGPLVALLIHPAIPGSIL